MGGAHFGGGGGERGSGRGEHRKGEVGFHNISLGCFPSMCARRRPHKKTWKKKRRKKFIFPPNHNHAANHLRGHSIHRRSTPHRCLKGESNSEKAPDPRTASIGIAFTIEQLPPFFFFLLLLLPALPPLSLLSLLTLSTLSTSPLLLPHPSLLLPLLPPPASPPSPSTQFSSSAAPSTLPPPSKPGSSSFPITSRLSHPPSTTVEAPD